MRSLDAYIRVSRVNGREGASFISPEVQREAIQRWADARPDVTIVGWYEELDKSATAGKRRPVFDELLGRVGKQSDGIVVWKLSRFGRSLIESATRLKKIEGAGGAVHSATEGDQSKLTRHIMLAIAEDEADRLAEAWANGQAKAVKRGAWIGPAPLGYDKQVLGTKPNGKPLYGQLEPNGDADAIRDGFAIAAADGMHAAQRHFAAEFPSMRWRTDDVRRVLRNRAYLGEHHAGGKPHDRLTDTATFAAAQTEPQARRTNGGYPLSHVATCANCGAGLVGALQTVRGKSYRRMRCSAVCKGGVGSIGADALEGHVRGLLAAGLVEVGGFVGSGDGVDVAQAALEAAERERIRFAQDADAHELLGADAWRAGLAARADKVAAAQAQLEQVASTAARTERLPAPESLGDPAMFTAALAVVASLEVSPGRGSIGDRVALDFVGADQPDDAPRVAAA